MYSNTSFQTISVEEFDASTSSQFMDSMLTSVSIVIVVITCSRCAGHLTDNAPLTGIYGLLNTDTLSVSTDSLSPRSYSSLSGDEETSSGKRRRSHSSLPQSPKRFKGGVYNIIDEVFPHSPESGIALSPPMTVYTQNPSCGKVVLEILEQPEEVRVATVCSSMGCDVSCFVVLPGQIRI